MAFEKFNFNMIDFTLITAHYVLIRDVLLSHISHIIGPVTMSSMGTKKQHNQSNENQIEKFHNNKYTKSF